MSGFDHTLRIGSNIAIARTLREDRPIKIVQL